MSRWGKSRIAELEYEIELLRTSNVKLMEVLEHVKRMWSNLELSPEESALLLKVSAAIAKAKEEK